MAGESLSFDIVGHDRASGSFRSAAAAAGDMSGKMDLAAKSAYLLQESLGKQAKAADASVGATLTLAKADKILADAERALSDEALAADLALRREAEAAKKSGRAAVEAAAENRTLADSMRKISDSSFFKPSGLGIAAALSPALIPLAGGIAAGIGAIGISFGAAATGAGLFGLTVKTVLTGIVANSKKLATAQAAVANATTAATRKTAAANLKNLTSGWSPDYKKIIAEYQVFTTKWQSVSQAVAVPVLVPWLTALTKAMKFLVPALKPVADVFLGWGQTLNKYFSSPANAAQISSMVAAFGRFSASQLRDVGRFIGDIAQGVFNLGKDFASSGANFSAAGTWLSNMGAGFLTWSKSSKARGEVQGFLHYLHTEGPVVQSILQSLGKILPGIFQGASTTGTLELQAISGFLGLIANLPKGWQKPLTEAAGAILLLSKTGVLSTGLKLTFPKADAGKGALAASLGMRLISGAFIVPATVMILGTIIPKDTSKQAAADFKNQPGIIVKVSDFLHTQGLGAWVDQYFSHPIRKWALTTLPGTLNTAASKVGVFLTKTIPTDALRMASSITGTFGKLPGPLGAPFRKAHAVIAGELAAIQFKAAQTARQINLDWDRLHGKKVTLSFGLGLPAGVTIPGARTGQRTAPIPGHAAGTSGAAPGWAWVGERGPELMHFKGGEQVIPNHMAKGLGGYAAGTVGDVAGNFPSSGMINAAAAAMQRAIGAVASAVKGKLHIGLSAFGAGGIGGNVRSYAGTVLQALSLLGQPSSDLGIVLSQMTSESGGNPLIVNKTDSNWAAGTPSVGLMQVIGPTFRAYAGPFRGVGPFEYGTSVNPLANIYAGLNYAIHRYGAGWTSVLGHGHGYANGTSSAAPGWALVGERGPELMKFRGGEQVRPAQFVPHGRSGGTVKHIFEIRAPHGATQLERAVAEMIRHTVTINGGDVQSALGRT